MYPIIYVYSYIHLNPIKRVSGHASQLSFHQDDDMKIILNEEELDANKILEPKKFFCI